MGKLRESPGTTGNAPAGSSSRVLGGPRRVFSSRSEQVAALQEEIRMFGLLLRVCYFRCVGRQRSVDRGGRRDGRVQGNPVGYRVDRGVAGDRCGSDDGCGGPVLACDGHSNYVASHECSGGADRTAWGSATAICTAAGIGVIVALGFGWLLVLKACMESKAAATERNRTQSIVRPASQVIEPGIKKTSGVFVSSDSSFVQGSDW